jgi:hypothetical protein
VAQVNDLSCDATPLALAQGDLFNPQPTGGTRLLEGNVEIRFPLGRQDLEGVGFVDFGQVWPEERSPSLDDLAWTPGFGARYYSVIGPIRLDLAYRPHVGEDVAVVTQRVRPCVRTEQNPGCTTLQTGGGFEPLDEIALLRPTVPFERGQLDDDGQLEPLAWWQRLQLHFSIGQAF